MLVKHQIEDIGMDFFTVFLLLSPLCSLFRFHTYIPFGCFTCWRRHFALLIYHGPNEDNDDDDEEEVITPYTFYLLRIDNTRAKSPFSPVHTQLFVCVCVSNKIINEYHAIVSLSPPAYAFFLSSFSLSCTLSHLAFTLISVQNNLYVV